MYRLEIGDGHSGLNLRGLNRGMTQHFLQMPDGCASTQHVRRTTMANVWVEMARLMFAARTDLRTTCQSAIGDIP